MDAALSKEDAHIIHEDSDSRMIVYKQPDDTGYCAIEHFVRGEWSETTGETLGRGETKLFLEGLEDE